MSRFRIFQTRYGEGDTGAEVQRRAAPNYMELLWEIGRMRTLLSERDAMVADCETRMNSLRLLNNAIKDEHDDIRRKHIEFVIKHKNTVYDIQLYHEYFIQLYKSQADEERELCLLLRERIARAHQLSMRFAEALQLIADEAGCDKQECMVCCESVYTIETECNHHICAKCFTAWHYTRNCNDLVMNCPMCRLPVV